MDGKKALKTAGKVLAYGAFGIAWPSMKRSVRLMKDEAARTADNTRLLGELAGQARKRVFGAAEARPADVADETFAEAMARRPGAEKRAYVGFVRRKRVALAMCALFCSIGGLGLVHGHLMGLAPMLVGGGLSLEFAWLAEFRLWQLRNRKLSAAEGGSLSDFWMDSGAWRRALDAEPGYGLQAGQKAYRRWLWAKRVGLLAMVLGLLCAVDLFFSRSAAYAGPAVAVAAAGLLVAMLVELKLSVIRHRLDRRSLPLAILRVEAGACYEEYMA
ncbi:hypothetical protein [Dyella ginsengisoli]|uniref:hypothetical protein n=1 Tax=Dyella ginsengisoli TaxID=363848 RepID=UPI0003457D62|nr:hypothetical protein [Dyella ginsengisoli]